MTYWNIEKYWLENKNVQTKLTVLREQIENLDKVGKLDEAAPRG